MLDIVLVAVTLALTLATFLYMAGCDVLMRTDPTRDESVPT
jgi:hypothetical protein